MRRISQHACLLALLCVTTAGWAQECPAGNGARSDRRRDLAEGARVAAAGGDHARALSLALCAGVIEMRPRLRLFIARQHQALHQLGEALASARLCITEASNDPAFDRVADCQELEPLSASPATPTPTPPPQPALSTSPRVVDVGSAQSLPQGLRDDAGVPIHPGAPAPVAASCFGTRRFTEMAAGSQHACAIDQGGGLWCWGQVTPSGGSPLADSGVDMRVNYVGSLTETLACD